MIGVYGDLGVNLYFSNVGGLALAVHLRSLLSHKHKLAAPLACKGLKLISCTMMTERPKHTVYRNSPNTNPNIFYPFERRMILVEKSKSSNK